MLHLCALRPCHGWRPLQSVALQIIFNMAALLLRLNENHQNTCRSQGRSSRFMIACLTCVPTGFVPYEEEIHISINHASFMVDLVWLIDRHSQNKADWRIHGGKYNPTIAETIITEEHTFSDSHLYIVFMYRTSRLLPSCIIEQTWKFAKLEPKKI